MIRVLDIRSCELRREVCQALVEDGMIVSLLAVAAVVLGIVGQDVTSLFTTVSTKFQDVNSP